MKYLDHTKAHLIAVKLSGKLDNEDLQTIHERIHPIIEKGQKVDFYFELEDFEGNTIKGFWEGIKIDTAHINDYGKIAFVGDEKWQKWAAKATEFFTGSDAKYFERANKSKAMAWMAS